MNNDLEDWRWEAGKRRMRHDDRWYGPMKGTKCGCDLCVWLDRYLLLADRVETLERQLESASPTSMEGDAV